MHGFTANDKPAQLLASSGLVLLVSWVVGTFYDAFRNLLEGLWDNLCNNKWEVNWDFFFKGEPEKVHKLEEYYYAYYTLDANLAIGIALFAVMHLLNFWFALLGRLPVWVYILLGLRQNI